MKKAVYLICVVLVFASCYGDEIVINEELNMPPDKIIGVWQKTETLWNGVAEPTGICDSLNTVEYRADGAYLNSNYGSDEITNEPCGVLYQTISWTWTNVGDDNYIVTTDTGETSDVPIHVVFEGENIWRFTFEADEHDINGDFVAHHIWIHTYIRI